MATNGPVASFLGYLPSVELKKVYCAECDKELILSQVKELDDFGRCFCSQECHVMFVLKEKDQEYELPIFVAGAGTDIFTDPVSCVGLEDPHPIKVSIGGL